MKKTNTRDDSRNKSLIEMFNGTDKTLQEIGDFFGITRERVRQIVSRGIAKEDHKEATKNRRDKRVKYDSGICKGCGKEFNYRIISGKKRVYCSKGCFYMSYLSLDERRERHLKWRKERYARIKDVILEQRRRYYKKNRDKRIRYNKSYYEKVKSDPALYAKRVEYYRNYNKLKMERIKNDPALYSEFLNKNREYYQKHRLDKKKHLLSD